MDKTCSYLLKLTLRCQKHTTSHIHQRKVMRIEFRRITKCVVTRRLLIIHWSDFGNKKVNCFLSLIFSGSLTKKSKNRGVHIEELKLAPIVDFASGMCSQNNWSSYCNFSGTLSLETLGFLCSKNAFLRLLIDWTRTFVVKCVWSLCYTVSENNVFRQQIQKVSAR